MSFRSCDKIAWLLWATCCCINSELTAQTTTKPNVIIILCDDLGYGDVGCYGATDIRTPRLDQMAQEGMQLTNFSVAAPLCSPSRAALLTGRHPARFGLESGVIRPNSQKGLPSAEFTLAELAKSAGYATKLIGKWHLGYQPGMMPREQGIESTYRVLYNLDSYETPYFNDVGGVPLQVNDTVIQRPAVAAGLTKHYTDDAIRFINANKKQPFFLLLAHAMPHLPYGAFKPFKGQSARGAYGDTVEELDASTGKILDHLRTLGLEKNTLVIFTSDNGPEKNTPGSAGTFRGTKHTLYEGGLRVPCLAWWPEKIPTGKVSREYITAFDLFPTLAQFTGAALPENIAYDGENVAPILLNEANAKASPEKTTYLVYGTGANRIEGVRQGKWKLLLTTPPQLFNLDLAPRENYNVHDRNPSVVEKLQSAAEGLKRNFGL